MMTTYSRWSSSLPTQGFDEGFADSGGSAMVAAPLLKVSLGWDSLYCHGLFHSLYEVLLCEVLVGVMNEQGAG